MNEDSDKVSNTEYVTAEDEWPRVGVYGLGSLPELHIETQDESFFIPLDETARLALIAQLLTLGEFISLSSGVPALAHAMSTALRGRN